MTVIAVASVGSRVEVDGETGFIDQVKHPSWWDENCPPPEAGDRLHVVVLDASREEPRFSALQRDIDMGRHLRDTEARDHPGRAGTAPQKAGSGGSPHMDSSPAAELQIHSVEDGGATPAVCIVRCMGGVVRTGQRFTTPPAVAVTGDPVLLSLDWIKCYERTVDFIHPPWNAKVGLSGSGVNSLTRGIILTALADEGP
ncbi:hypothetical protein [Streptomyces sp. 840.1]|uniref:hypothetical protein n=1 Tax=Streptomyces sp. 840.1 TaxID=2485152 RepID=UPI0021A3F809|nr:hypothetical protein [Streptomyces sp. 840.1]